VLTNRVVTLAKPAPGPYLSYIANGRYAP